MGLSGWLVAYVLDPAGALRAWLAAWTFGLSIALGSLGLVMLGHVTGAKWVVVLRRVAEATAMSLPILALGVLPVLLGASLLYPWAGPVSTLPEDLVGRLAQLPRWLDPTFFSIRAVLYITVWIALAGWLWRASVRQETSAARGRRAETPRRATVGVSAAGLVLLALSLTFASFDWLMSLAPSWSSRAFGAYWLTGGMVASLSALVLITRGLRSANVLGGVIADAHDQALGVLLSVFVAFWGCVAYLQVFAAWIGAVPSVPWLHTWGGAAMLLGIGAVHFVLPFLILLRHSAEHHPHRLHRVAVWLLVAHWVDTSWLVGPILGPLDLLPGYADVAALVAVVGLGVASGAWVLDGKAPIPLGDPRLEASIRYEIG